MGIGMLRRNYNTAPTPKSLSPAEQLAAELESERAKVSRLQSELADARAAKASESVIHFGIDLANVDAVKRALDEAKAVIDELTARNDALATELSEAKAAAVKVTPAPAVTPPDTELALADAVFAQVAKADLQPTPTPPVHPEPQTKPGPKRGGR